MTRNVSVLLLRFMVAMAVPLLVTSPAAQAQVPATGVTLDATLPSPQLAGTPVVFTASGVGSTNYQYRFFHQAAGGSAFTLAQDWSPAATWTMPATLPAGGYLVVVHVRTGTAGFDAQAWTFYTLSPRRATGVTLAAERPSPQAVGTPVAFTAAGVGSTSYQYRFFHQAAGSTAFTLAQDWSPAATWTMPAGLAAGDYLVVVHVRTGDAGFDAQAWMSFTLVPAPATGVTLVADLPGPRLEGTPVVFTAAGVGSANYQYRFFYRAPGSGAFTLAQDWSEAATWTMPALAAGDYLVVVHVRTGGGGFDAQAWTDYTLTPLPSRTVVIRESFGLGSTAERPAGGKGNLKPSVGGFAGFWAEFPADGSVTWSAEPQTWQFAGCSDDPHEGPSPLQVLGNGCTFSPFADGAARFPSAFVPFRGVAGRYEVSADVTPPHLAGAHVAIGLSASALTVGNLQTAGQLSLIVREAAQLDGTHGEYELRVGRAVLASGSFLLNGYNPIALRYDPATLQASAVVSGVVVGPFAAPGVAPTQAVIEGQGVLDNFVVAALR